MCVKAIFKKGDPCKRDRKGTLTTWKERVENILNYIFHFLYSKKEMKHVCEAMRHSHVLVFCVFYMKNGILLY